MLGMRRLLPLALAALLLIAVPAAARIIELGQAADNPRPSCPGSACRIITRTTGYTTRAGATRSPVTVRRDGRIAAVTLRLGNPGKKLVAIFDQQYGGTSRLQVTVLNPGKHLFYTTVAQSEQFRIQPYFGQTVQIPLRRTLPVAKGQIVAITVPTWAPMLAVNLGPTSTWRAARGATTKCTDFTTQTAQVSLNQSTQYRCQYSTARPTYRVTEIATPKVPPVVEPNT